VHSEGMCVVEQHAQRHVPNTLKSDKACIVPVHCVPVTPEQVLGIRVNFNAREWLP